MPKYFHPYDGESITFESAADDKMLDEMSAGLSAELLQEEYAVRHGTRKKLIAEMETKSNNKEA